MRQSAARGEHEGADNGRGRTGGSVPANAGEGVLRFDTEEWFGHGSPPWSADAARLLSTLLSAGFEEGSGVAAGESATDGFIAGGKQPVGGGAKLG